MMPGAGGRGPGQGPGAQDLVTGVPAPPGISRGAPGGLAALRTPPQLFGKMAPATLEISIPRGNQLNIPAPGARRAPGAPSKAAPGGILS